MNSDFGIVRIKPYLLKKEKSADRAFLGGLYETVVEA